MNIERRDFLKSGVAFSALAMLPTALRAAPAIDAFEPVPGAWRSFEVMTRIAIPRTPGAVRAWVPLPSVEAADWIRPRGDRWTSNGNASLQRSGDARMLAFEWTDGTDAPSLEVRSRIATRDRAVDLNRTATPSPLTAAERARYTAGTALVPIDGIVAETAKAITGGALSDVAKAHRIYEWVVANTFRDPSTRGCGTGNVAAMLRSGRLGGKCADLNALFVGLARASGVPARELYGIRVAPSRFGYRSLGTNGPDSTKAQHCRAEVYLGNVGWVPMDPADVRKVMLEESPGSLPLDEPRVDAARRTLFGAWETNWIAYNDSRDVTLPGSSGPSVGFLMYPQAETAAGRFDCLDADAFGYAISAREIAV